MDSYRVVLRETINGYVFWSLFQGLGPMIWFYPLNELDISGYEAFAATWFFPIIVALPAVHQTIQFPWILAVLRLLSSASLASFLAQTTLQRLQILAIGAGINMLVFVATMFNYDYRIRSRTFWGLMLGLMAFISSRVWLTSFVPTWWSKETNSVVIALAVIANIDQIISGGDSRFSKIKVLEPKLEMPYWFPTAIGFGSLLYLTHWCFGEVSLITRWTVTGYPDHGPMPYPWGAGVLVCLAVGVYMSACKHLAQSKIWWAVGAASLAALYYLPTWYGYIGKFMWWTIGAALLADLYYLPTWYGYIHVGKYICWTVGAASLAALYYLPTWYGYIGKYIWWATGAASPAALYYLPTWYGYIYVGKYIWWTVGAASLAALYYLPTWYGYIGKYMW